MKFSLLLLASFSLFISTTAQAKIYVAPGFFISSEQTVSGGTTSNDDRTHINLRVGVENGSLMYGVIYHSESFSTDNKITAIGASIGYKPSGGFMLMASYTLDNKYISGSSEFKGSFGYILDIAYLFRTGLGFEFGPNLMYKSFKFTEDASGATADITRTGYLPALLLKFDF